MTGTARIGRRRALGRADAGGWARWLLWWAVAGAAGCGDGGEAPASPPLLPPPEPPPSRVSTLFLGFVEERIEIVEGEGAAVDIAFEPYYWVAPDVADRWVLDVRAVVEAGSASAEDLVVGGVRIGAEVQILESGTTWLGLRALADGVEEAPETLRLRLEPVAAANRGGSYPEVVEVTNAELEVVIRDAEAADICADVRITATKPRFGAQGGWSGELPIARSVRNGCDGGVGAGDGAAVGPAGVAGADLRVAGGAAGVAGAA